jgi:hypothetical protein
MFCWGRLLFPRFDEIIDAELEEGKKKMMIADLNELAIRPVAERLQKEGF